GRDRDRLRRRRVMQDRNQRAGEDGWRQLGLSFHLSPPCSRTEGEHLRSVAYAVASAIIVSPALRREPLGPALAQLGEPRRDPDGVVLERHFSFSGQAGV